MDIESQKNVLLDAIQQQYNDNVAAVEANRRLADEKIGYQNEARGTYYSGIPTWERSQNAITYGEKMNELNKNLQSAQNNIWSTVSNYLDKINAYNEAAKSASSSGLNKSGYSTSLGDYYTSNRGFQFTDENGNPIKASTWANNVGYDPWAVIQAMANAGDINAKRALAGRGNANKQLTDEEIAAFGLLGLSTEGYGRRD